MQTKRRFYIVKKWNTVEQIIYGLIWLILIMVPLVFWDFSDSDEKRRIIGGWIKIAPFLIIFLLHNWVLLPGLLLRKQYAAYIISVIVLMLFINYWFVISDFIQQTIRHWLFDEQLPPDQHFVPPPDRGMPPPRHLRMHQGMGAERVWSRQGSPYLLYTYNVFISILIIGVNTSLRFTTQWFKQEQDRKETEKENLHSQLIALRHQVSPHFFMNTLNNIHALIEYDKDSAKEAVLQLSKMMRHLLYESDDGTTSLNRELEFLKNYIDLMRLRLQPEVDLQLNFPPSLPDRDTHSLLGLSVIENAFKHGINPRGDSFIHILFEVHQDSIHINCHNSKVTSAKTSNEPGGIGLQNTQKRLKILFGDDYTFNIYNRETEFEVDLIYPLL